MKILVITGSPRKNGNSNTLVEHFIKGAQEKGHLVERFDSAAKKVHPCIACDKCAQNGTCVFDDDFNFVKENILDADMVVFASPVYYFSMSAQIKTVIDRFYAINDKISTPKKAVLILSYADTSKSVAEPIIKHYETMLDYLGWSDCGKLLAQGVWRTGDVDKTDYCKQAYNLGKNI